MASVMPNDVVDVNQLEEYYKGELRKRDRYIEKLGKILRDVISCNKETAREYDRLAKDIKAEHHAILHDCFSFYYRARGIEEATNNLRNALEREE